MATMICLMIADDGTMSVGAGDGEMPEGVKATPVKSLDDAVSAIKQLAAAASMPSDQQQAPEGSAAEETQEGEDPSQPDDDEAQEAAMMGAYRPGQTGRG